MMVFAEGDECHMTYKRSKNLQQVYSGGDTNDIGID